MPMKPKKSSFSKPWHDFRFHAQRMRYQPNSLSYGIIMLSIVVSLIAMFSLINYDSFLPDLGAQRVAPDLRIGFEILVAIVSLLVSFLAAEKVKCYDPVWAFGIVYALALVQFWRMASLPAYVCFEKGWVPYELANRGYFLFQISGILMVIAGLIATAKVIILRKYGKETGR